MRRGQPTTWVRHGASQAINAGDLLLMLPFLAVGHGNLPAPVRWRLSEALARHATSIVRGQVEDLDLLSSENFQQSSYLRVVRNKTGGLFSLPFAPPPPRPGPWFGLVWAVTDGPCWRT